MEFRQKIGSEISKNSFPIKETSKSDLGFEILTPRSIWGQIIMAIGVIFDGFLDEINEKLS